jgi:N-acetylated-alpha-linked acidic dipeptidase
MKLDVPRPMTKIVNVTGVIRGRERPEEIVLCGNHRDAWVFGAVDPSSGSATMLELARALGRLKTGGFRPRRTIMLASWDAEEFALTGSTEWGEQHLDDLRRNLVAYLNVDSSTSGSRFSATATGAIAPLVEEVLKDVRDPETGRPLHRRWKASTVGGGATALASGGGEVGPIGSGSDHTVFLNLVGAPAVDMTFEGDYGVYHSAYDDVLWMTRFGDPGFVYMTLMAEVWGRLALRLAEAEVLPFDYGHYAGRIEERLDSLGREFPEARAALKELADAGRLLRTVAERPRMFENSTKVYVDRLNRALIAAERALCDEKGLPDRPWFKHLVYACRYTYRPLVLPGLTEAVEANDEARIAERERALAEVLRRAARALAGAWLNHRFERRPFPRE